MEELLRYTRALLLLQLQTAQAAAEQGQGPQLRLELLLADAGFTARDIAAMLGKTTVATAKAISRARAAKQRNVPEEAPTVVGAE